MIIQDRIGILVGKFIKSDIGDILDKLMKIVLVAAAYLAMFVAIGFFMSYPVMRLWNGCLVPAVVGFHLITWKQAWGIMILTSLMFKSTSVSSSKSKEK